MPALSSTMTEGKIVEWTVKVGDKVKAGDTIMVVESDKADMDVESFETGFVAAILAKAGEATPVGAPCALLVDNEADIEKVKAGLASGASVGSAAPAAAAAPAPAAAAPAAANAPAKPAFEFSEVLMPALSSTMTSGKIVAWTAKVGDKIKSGDTVMVVESDKVSQPTSKQAMFHAYACVFLIVDAAVLLIFDDIYTHRLIWMSSHSKPEL